MQAALGRALAGTDMWLLKLCYHFLVCRCFIKPVQFHFKGFVYEELNVMLLNMICPAETVPSMPANIERHATGV